MLANYGIRLAGIVFDTMIASHLLNPSTRGHSLDGIAMNLFGYKTIAYEIVEASAVPEIDWVVVPLSMGDGLHGIWQGFVELEQLGLIDRLPRMVSVEPAEAAPVASGFAAGADHLDAVPRDPAPRAAAQ